MSEWKLDSSDFSGARKYEVAAAGPRLEKSFPRTLLLPDMSAEDDGTPLPGLVMGVAELIPRKLPQTTHTSKIYYNISRLGAVVNLPIF